MELVLGSHVREAGRRVDELAGFELEPVDLRIRRIIFSPDGELGPQAMTRPLAAIASVHDDGEVELRSDVDIAPMPAVAGRHPAEPRHANPARRPPTGSTERRRGRPRGTEAGVRIRTAALVVAALHARRLGSRLLDAG